MATDTHLRRTPLYEAHLESNARMVDFAGWEMPVLYTSILDEARIVRNHVGMFDISHMGRTRITGGEARSLLQKLTTNDVDSLKPSEAHYSLLTNPQGGIIDDIIVYCIGAENYLVVINASNTQKDLEWLRSHSEGGVTIADDTEATAMIAVQGPDAPALVASFADSKDLLSLDRFEHARGKLADCDVIFCRTGYTGEDGFELITHADCGEAVWKLLLNAGAVPCGLGARDTLRIEAGYPLYGHEIDDMTSPVDAGLMWVVQLEKGEFPGSDAIRARKQAGPVRKLVGLRCQGRLQPRQGYYIYAGTDKIGVITSGTFSPICNAGVALGYVSARHSRTGTQVEVAARDKQVLATVCPKKSLLDGVAM